MDKTKGTKFLSVGIQLSAVIFLLVYFGTSLDKHFLFKNVFTLLAVLLSLVYLFYTLLYKLK
jgi:hypothetical protein